MHKIYSEKFSSFCSFSSFCRKGHSFETHVQKRYSKLIFADFIFRNANDKNLVEGITEGSVVGTEEKQQEW